MKKKYQTLTTFTIIILLTFFAGTSWGQIWTGDYTIMDSDDIAALSGYTEVTGTLKIGSTSTGATPTTLESLERLESLTSIGGNLTIENTTLTSLSGLNNLTSVGRYLRIEYNVALTSLSGLDSINSVGGALYIWDNDALTSLSGLNNLTMVGALYIYGNKFLTNLSGLDNLTSVGDDLNIRYNNSLVNLCALYNVVLMGNLQVFNNSVLSMDTAYALETQLRDNGYTGTSSINGNNGTVNIFCGVDSDGDSYLDTEDNCPAVPNPNQEDADNDTMGDVCDPDTIYGTISGAVQGGVTIDIDVYSCGTATTVATVTTNEEGYYAVGGLGTDSYGIVPQYSDYVFSPKTLILRVPQTSIRSYDFTATVAP